MLMFVPVVPAILTRNKRHFGIAIGDGILGDARFLFLPKKNLLGEEVTYVT